MSMIKKKKDLPYFPFYFGDWLKCPEVRAMDLETRMIWFEMLGLMFESTNRGYLTINNNPIDTDTLSRILGISKEKLSSALNLMVKLNVYSIRESDGAIYNRRMVRDEEIRVKRSEGGYLGGNPKLNKVKQKVNLRGYPSVEPSSDIDIDIDIENKDVDLNVLELKGDARGDSFSMFEKEIFNLWNDLADKHPVISKIKNISTTRRNKLKTRYSDTIFRDLKSIFEKIPEQKFLMGNNDRRWIITFDWLIENDTNYLKVLEGRYKNGSYRSDIEKARDTQNDIIEETAGAFKLLRERQLARKTPCEDIEIAGYLREVPDSGASCDDGRNLITEDEI